MQVFPSLCRLLFGICSLPDPSDAPHDPVVWAPSTKRDASVANAAVAIAFQGMRPSSSPHKVLLSTLLREHGWALRDHPMWLHVTECPPHDGVIKRLAHALNVPLPGVEHGYRSGDEFVAQVTGFIAWYAVPRSCPAHATVLARLKDLASRLDADGPCVGPAVDAGACVDLADPAIGGEDPVVGGGITDTESLRDALRTVQNPVVVQGLLNNQLAPSGIPKGICAWSGSICLALPIHESSSSVLSDVWFRYQSKRKLPLIRGYMPYDLHSLHGYV